MGNYENVINNITRIKTGRDNVATAIRNKGVSVPSGTLISDLAKYVNKIELPSGNDSGVAGAIIDYFISKGFINDDIIYKCSFTLGSSYTFMNNSQLSVFVDDPDRSLVPVYSNFIVLDWRIGSTHHYGVSCGSYISLDSLEVEFLGAKQNWYNELTVYFTTDSSSSYSNPKLYIGAFNKSSASFEKYVSAGYYFPTDEGNCVGCGACIDYNVCPYNAIYINGEFGVNVDICSSSGCNQECADNISGACPVNVVFDMQYVSGATSIIDQMKSMVANASLLPNNFAGPLFNNVYS